MTKRNHSRGPEGVALSISTNKLLREAINKAAAKEGRTVSNFVANTVALALGMGGEVVIPPVKRAPKPSPLAPKNMRPSYVPPAQDEQQSA